jgi:hypothetical protein
MALVATTGSVALFFTPLSASQEKDAKPAVHPSPLSAATDSYIGFAVTSVNGVSKLNSRPNATVAPGQ